MYENFFSFQSRPFSAAPNVRLYFPADSIEHARHTFTQSIDRGDGAAILVGPAGAGKSLLMHVLAEQYKDEFEVVLLTSARLCTRRALLQNILFELKLPYRKMEEGELRLSLIDQLDPSNSSGMLLLVDEAHTLPTRLLEEIRMITNLVRDGGPRVRLVLAGTRKLEEQLALPKLDSLNQRVASRCYLEAIPMEDTINMVRRQIVAVGGDPNEVFSPEAIEAIHRAADGIPRLINQLADHALLLACVGGQHQVTESGVNEAWADIQQLPSPWNTENSKQELETVGDGESMIEFGSLDDDELFTDDTLNAVDETIEEFDADEFVPAPTAAEEDKEQVELRLAPISLPVTGASPEQPTTDSETPRDGTVRVFGEFDPAPTHRLSLADDDVLSTESSTEKNDVVTGMESDELFATPITTPITATESMDDPFSESFEDEEVVIESTQRDVPAVAVPTGGPLSAEYADLFHDDLFHDDLSHNDSNELPVDSVTTEPCEILTWSTAESGDTMETLVATIGVDSADYELPSPIVTIGEPLRETEIEITSDESADTTDTGADLERADVELTDADEWEPSFSEISTEDIETNEAGASGQVDVTLPADDLIDESAVAVDDQEVIVIDDDPLVDSKLEPERTARAQAIVKDYRQLFAQLRRG